MKLPRPTTLLLLDDDPFMLSHLPRLLMNRTEGSDLRIVPCPGFPQALDALAEQPRDERRLVVLADYDLGEERTGIDLLVEVAAKRPDALRLLYSAHARSELQAAIDSTPVHAFLEKPLRLDVLLAPLIRHLASEENPRPAPPAAETSLDVPAAPRRPPISRDFQPGVSPRGDEGELPDAVFRHLVTSVADYAIFMLDTHGRIRSWNLGAQRMKGYDAAEVLGKHFSIFYPANEVANHRPQFELKVAGRDGRYEDTGWRLRKGGGMFWANVVITGVRDDNNELIGFAKVTRDLTERKHAEEALRQSEERYRLLIESVKDYAIFMLDPLGRIVSWNEGAERIKGYKASDIIGEHFSIFYTQPDRDRNHPQDELRMALRDGAYEEEGMRVRKDGTTFWANVVITSLYGPNGEHRGFAKVTRDLTTRREAEERIRRQAQEYQDLSRELESFSYTVAHDLRAPLRAVVHLADVLVTDEEMPEPERAETLRALRASAERMGTLVEDLLNLSRATKSDFVGRPLDVAALARASLADLPSPPKRPGVEFRIADNMRAEGDPRLLRIVLDNLLGNAYKFTRKQPKPLVEVGVTEQDGRRVFFVRDNGVGFDPTMAHRLFRPFQRLHGVNEYEGTGIGLATVQRIIHRHGGEVWAVGSPGEGATFYFTLGTRRA